jgi:hypothetical protein
VHADVRQQRVEAAKEGWVGGARGKAASLVGSERRVQGSESVLRDPEVGLVHRRDGQSQGQEQQRSAPGRVVVRKAAAVDPSAASSQAKLHVGRCDSGERGEAGGDVLLDG